MTDPEELSIGRADTMLSPRAWKQVFSWILFALLYLASARLSVSWTFTDEEMPPISLSTGVAFAALLLVGPRIWPAIWVAACALEKGYGGIGWVDSVAFASGYTLALLVGRWGLQRTGTEDAGFGRTGDTLYFLLMGGVVVPVLIVASIAITWFATGAWPDDVLIAGSARGLEETLGILLATPLVLAWRDIARVPLGWRAVVELSLLVLFTCLAAAVAYGYLPLLPEGPQSLTFLVTPALVWAVLRFRMRGITLALLLVALFVQWSVIRGIGPFVGPSVVDSVLGAQLYLLVLAITALVAGTVLQEREAARERALLGERIIEQTAEGVMITLPDETIVAVNPAFTETTGYSPEEVIGRTPALLQSGLHDAAFYQEMKKTLRESGRWQGEVWNRRKNGEVYSELLSISTLRDDKGNPFRYVGMFSDLSHQPHVKERIRRLAYYDTLTRLPNRQLFMDRLGLALVQAQRGGAKLALLYLDLDHFKQINDTFGHPVGDRVLQIFAARLQSCVRRGDTCARLGGDEFTALLPEVHGQGDVAAVAEKVQRALASPFELGGETHEVSVSIGAALYPSHGEDAAMLLAHADQAMYEVKREGRGGFRMFAGN